MSANRTLAPEKRPLAEHLGVGIAKNVLAKAGMCVGTLSAMTKSVMNSLFNRNMITALGASDQGSILMEYMLVQVLVACLLMLVMNELFYNWGTAQFGPGGMAIKYFYQRLLGGLSLPVP